MLEQPCAICGHMLESADDVCSRCGVRRRPRRREPGTSWPRYVGSMLFGGVLGSVIGGATTLAGQASDAGVTLGLATLGGLGGLIVAWMLSRRSRA